MSVRRGSGAFGPILAQNRWPKRSADGSGVHAARRERCAPWATAGAQRSARVDAEQVHCYDKRARALSPSALRGALRGARILRRDSGGEIGDCLTWLCVCGVMQLAIEEARRALRRGEVPVGCVLRTADGTTVATGSNRTNERGNATSHAEMVAFEQLSKLHKRFEKGQLTLYVTCEPCIMCAAAIVQMQVIGRIVYGCSNPRFGGCGSVRALRMYQNSSNVHIPSVQSGVDAATAVQLLEQFYKTTNPHAPKPKRRKVKL